MILYKKNIIFIVFLILNGIFIPTSFAQKKNAKDLAKINKQIETKKKEAKKLEKQTKQLQKEIKTTQNKMVEIANNVKKYERQLTNYDNELFSLKIKEKNLNQKIENNNNELIKIIAVFENISMTPKGYLIVSPSKIDTVFQSSLLLKSIVSYLNERRSEFTKDLNDLIKLKEEIMDAKLKIYSLNNKVKGEKDKISNLIKTKQSSYNKLTKQNKQKQKEIKKLISESKTIEEFLKKAEKLRKKEEEEKRLAGIKTSKRVFTGKMPLPVDGEIDIYYGENKVSGVKSKGLYIKPRKNAQVISPTDAEVIFSGSFYGYNNLLILHGNDDYYIIMGGMDEIYTSEGQTLLAGEPIGQMGNTDFYLEIRQDETPINPLKYFKI